MSELDDLFAGLFNADDRLAESAALSLPQHGQAALERLSRSLKSPDPDRRWWVVRALAAFDLPEVFPLLIQALSDDDHDVVACALLAMRSRPDVSHVPHLLPLLSSNINNFSRLAADALIAVGPAAAPILIEYTESPDQPPPSEAVRALAHLDDYRAVPTLFRLLDSDNPLVEYWAQQGLENLSIGMAFFSPD